MTLTSLRALCEIIFYSELIPGDWTIIRRAFPLLVDVAGVAANRPNKFGPHYMIWQDKMDAALRALKEEG